MAASFEVKGHLRTPGGAVCSGHPRRCLCALAVVTPHAVFPHGFRGVRDAGYGLRHSQEQVPSWRRRKARVATLVVITGAGGFPLRQNNNIAPLCGAYCWRRSRGADRNRPATRPPARRRSGVSCPCQSKNNGNGCISPYPWRSPPRPWWRFQIYPVGVMKIPVVGMSVSKYATPYMSSRMDEYDAAYC